ncbi:MAG: aspartyl/asparaginyl beta-hydroxylase domain-containing protein [Rubrivivax sp.]
MLSPIKIRQLREIATASSAASTAQWAAALQERGTPAVDDAAWWVLSAERAANNGERVAALRAWHQAACLGAQGWDQEVLDALGLGTAAAWQQRAASMTQEKASLLRESYAEIRRAAGVRALFRIDRALAGYLGEASVFSSHPMQRPKVMYVPGLQSGGFIDPASHPLVSPLAANWQTLREDFLSALSGGDGIEPFLGTADATVSSEYVSGREGASWDALFFFRHGRRYTENHARFPRSSALLDSLDLCVIDGQAPEVCFSILQPGSRIEPHHGVTNARVVIHIPLKVPQGCFLELTDVGRHHWREGEAFVFDDTFEHSAENPTQEVRGILLMDAWHPELTMPERMAFRAIIEALTLLEAPPDSP